MPNWDELDDKQLLVEAQDGNPEAFGELYSRYTGMIFRYLYSHLDDRRDAEDLLNEVFLKAWRSISGYQYQGVPFSAFLFRIARNILVDFYRRSSQLRDVVSVDDDQDEHPESISDQLEHRELVNLLQQLEEDYRMVLILRFLTGLSPVETATVMGRSVGAVRILQYRALGRLRTLLNKV